MNRLLEISRRSLQTYQQALNVTSHNINNAENEDYSRQRVVLTSEDPDYLVPFWIGSGVKIEDVRRLKDEIVESNIRQFNARSSYTDKKSEILSITESFFTEPDELGLSQLINDFFNSWDALSVDPTSDPLRSDVVITAEKLSDKFRYINENYDQTRRDLRIEAEAQTEKVNALLGDIQKINQQIAFWGPTTNTAINDLLDKRDAYINELSKLVNVNVAYEDNNIANISIGGVFAADAAFRNEFKLEVVNDKMVMTIDADEEMRVAMTGGEIYAIAETYSQSLPDYQKQINRLAETIYNEVNAIHVNGYSLQDPPVTGLQFFDRYEKGMLNINENILNDNRFIAVSADGNLGNNEIGLQLADLKNKKLIDGYTLSDKYITIIDDLASEIDILDQNSRTYELALDQLAQQKASYSGVSLDEEWTNVLRFQRSYDAAAKLTSVADEMLQTVLNMV